MRIVHTVCGDLRPGKRAFEEEEFKWYAGHESGEATDLGAMHCSGKKKKTRSRGQVGSMYQIRDKPRKNLPRTKNLSSTVRSRAVANVTRTFCILCHAMFRLTHFTPYTSPTLNIRHIQAPPPPPFHIAH